MSDQELETRDEKTPSIEESFDRIEDIIDRMEQRDVTLSDSFALYQEGIKQLKNCSDLLDKVEKELLIINGEE